MPEGKVTCQIRLKSPPDCGSRSTRAAYAMCWAREVGVKQNGMDMGSALRTGWGKVKEKCSR